MTIRVLLADDHALVREGLRVLLTANPGISVIGDVGNGRDAVHLAADLNPDVVIMDVSMPDLNGIEAARMMRVKCPAARIIMLSMHSTTEHVYRALEVGATGYVLKDSASNEVIAAVQTVHAGRRYFSLALRSYVPEPLGRETGELSPLDSLSSRERQVLQLVVEGKSSAEIAARIHLSPKTVDTYRSRLMKKLGVSDVPALVKFAVQHGLTPGG